jgi:hypothetical protein
MSKWESRVRDHRVWSIIESLGPSIDRASALENSEPAALEDLLRLRSVLTLCGKRLGATDALCIAPSSLEEIANAFTPLKSEVDAYISDRNIGHLTNANANADAAIIGLSRLPGVQSSEELIQLNRLVSEYRSSIDSAAHELLEQSQSSRDRLNKLQTELDAFKNQTQVSLAELKTQISSEQQRLAALATEQQKSFTEAQADRNNSYTDTLRKTQESLNKTLTDQQGQFSTSQETRNAQFSAVLADGQKRMNDLAGDYTKKLAEQDAGFTKQKDALFLDANKKIDELNAKYRGDAEKILEKVSEKREEVETLVGVIGSLGVTSGYQKTANRAERSMWAWQIATVLAMVFLIGFAYHAFIPTLVGEFHWSSFAGRVFLTITVGVLAAYAGTQADRFYHMEKQNRRLALELAAIDPFIALLPQDEQQKFKLEIGRRTFAQDGIDGPAPHSKSPATTFDLLTGTKEGKQLLEIIQTTLDIINKTPKI